MNKSGKLTALFLSALILMGGAGCMKKEKQTRINIETYLTNKYHQIFSYDSTGNDVWSSKTQTLIYADKNNRLFSVKDRDGYYMDNYGSVMFDEEIQKYLQMSFDENFKIFVNTQSAFFESNIQFLSYKDYMQQCPVINISIYTAKTENGESIAEILRPISDGCVFSVTAYHVSDDVYNQIESYAEKPSSYALSSDSFWIENNEITSSN